MSSAARKLMSASGSVADTTPKAIAVAHSDFPYVTAYSWSDSGFGGKFVNPATLPQIGRAHV